MCIIKDNLPEPAKGHHFEIERVSKMVAKVWLVRDQWSHLLEKEVRTIYCFIKGSKNLTVHKPKNAKIAYVRSFCSFEELGNQSSYSLFKPNVAKLYD